MGFGHTLAKGVEQAVAQQGFVGIFTGGLTACSGGVSASLIFALIASVFAKSKSQS
jgi:stage V sporulation protein AE